MNMSTSAITETPLISEPKKEFLITADSRGNILVDGTKKVPLFKILNIFKLLLAELYFQYGIVRSRKKAIEVICQAKIEDCKYFITIEVHPELEEFRKKFPKQKKWDIPLDIPQMHNFMLGKMPD